MAEPKTRPTDANVSDYVAAIADPKRQQAAITIMALLDDITGEKPVLWGDAIVGYGSYMTTTKPPAPWPLIAFSPRSDSLTVYIMGGLQEQTALLENLGKYKTKGSCLHIKSIDDIDQNRLKALLQWSYDTMRARHPQ